MPFGLRVVDGFSASSASPSTSVSSRARRLRRFNSLSMNSYRKTKEKQYKWMGIRLDMIPSNDTNSIHLLPERNTVL